MRGGQWFPLQQLENRYKPDGALSTFYRQGFAPRLLRSAVRRGPGKRMKAGNGKLLEAEAAKAGPYLPL